MSFFGKCLGGQNTKYVFLFFVEYVQIYAFFGPNGPKIWGRRTKTDSTDQGAHIQTYRKALLTHAVYNALSHNNFSAICSCVHMGAKEQKINIVTRGMGVRISHWKMMMPWEKEEKNYN